jgi:hypothetical protein
LRGEVRIANGAAVRGEVFREHKKKESEEEEREREGVRYSGN